MYKKEHMIHKIKNINKESLRRLSLQQISDVISYTSPKLYTGKSWYIGFYAYDPDQKRMRRKRIKLNRIEKTGERRRYADGLIKRLHRNLEAGWSPWVSNIRSKSNNSFSEVCDHYRRNITELRDDGILRKDTYRSYISQLKNIEDWNNQKENRIHSISEFNKSFITTFLEYIYLEKKNSARTRNNYLTFIRILCTFLVDHQYLDHKPCEGIVSISKKNLQKERSVINDKDLKRLNEYLYENNKYYLLACHILFYCFVRPKEMSYIKISHISIERQTLFIPKESSKNRIDGVVTLPTYVINLILELNVLSSSNNYYLFSNNFKPGLQHRASKQFTDYWLKVRKALKFPTKYQFYSLKDTGITNMLKTHDIITVRDQARHSDMLMTDKYTPHEIKEANPIIKNYEGNF